MAITRAQQAKQMLQDGGRIGFRVGTGEGKDTSGRDYGGGVGRSDTSSQYGGGDYDSSQNVSGRNLTNFTGRDPTKQFSPEAQKIAREMLDAKMGAGDRFVPNFFPIIKGLANRFQVSKPTPFDLQRKEFIKALRPQAVDMSGGDAGQDIPYWAQLGFSSEAEYLASLRAQAPSDMDQETEEEPFQLSRRFRAEGGRAGFQEGGIMPRLNQLGSGVSSAEQTLQDINQRLKSAESSLGSGGGMQSPFTDQGSIVPQGGSIGSLTRPINADLPDKLIPALNTPLVNNMGFNFRQPGDMGRYVADNDPGGIMAGYSSYQDYLNAGNDPISRPQGPQPLLAQGQVSALSAQGGLSGIPAASYANGGNVVGGEFDFESARQMYGLGKLVKKVTRTVKKIAKSPVGKAALLYGGFKGFQALGGGTGIMSKLFGSPAVAGSGRDFFMGIGGKSAATKGLFGKLGLTAGGGSLMPTALGGIAAASALAGLLTPAQEEEAQELSRGEGIDIEAARRSILNAGTAQDFRARRFRA